MRSDMKKVVVERPRRYGETKGQYAKTHREPQRIKNDLESAPTKAPLRDRKRRTKEFNEHLAPLRRFIRKNVGRPWYKVWSEIVAGLGGGKGTLQAHVLGHAKDYVEIDVEMVDGVPHKRDFGKLIPVARNGIRMNDFYVHPESGLLLIAKPPRKKSDDFQIHRLSGTSAAVRWNGHWYLATLKNMVFRINVAAAVPERDAWLEQDVGEYEATKLWGKYKGRAQYAAAIRPMKKAEVKRLALDRGITGV